MFRNRLAMAVLAGLGMAGLCRAAEDAGTDKAPDWSKYKTVGEVVGEVVKADPNGLTLRVTWYVPQVQRSGNGGNRNRGRGRRPGIGGNQNFRNPFAQNRSRGARVTLKEEHHDYDMRFVDESLVRFKSLPPRLDSNGKKMPYTVKEKDALSKPVGVPGYRATREDLTAGTIIDVKVVRPRSGTDDDLVVRQAMILGHDPTPSAADGKAKKK
jgi:hypothetical protein